MARGQDAPIRQGGQIDPYVASSAQQRKQQAENRLLTATKEAAAGQRQAVSERGADIRSITQMRGQERMQAAQIEADDRRSAEKEEARRNDQIFAETMQEESQAFQAEQSKLERLHEEAVNQKEYDRADKLAEKLEAARRFDFELELDDRERATNAMLSMTKMGMQQEANRQKAITTLMKESEAAEQASEVRQQVENRAMEGFAADNRMHLPTFEELKAGEPQYGLMDAVDPIGGIKKVLGRRETRKEMAKGMAAPMNVLQDQLARAGTSVGVADLHPSNLRLLDDQVKEGKFKAQDIRNAHAVLEGAIKVMDQKIISAEGEQAKAAWRKTKADILQMRNSVEKLRRSKTTIQGSDNETVGTRVRSALAIDSSVGGMINTLKQSLGTTDYGAILDEMTKGMNPTALKPVDPSMGEYDRYLREQYNSILLRKYPELGANQ